MPAPVTPHVILFVGPVASGPTAAVCSVSDVVTLGAPDDARPGDPFAVGLDFGEILIGRDDTLVLYALEGAPTRDAARLRGQSTGVVAFVPADAPDPLAIALAQLDAHEPLLARGGDEPLVAPPQVQPGHRQGPLDGRGNGGGDDRRPHRPAGEHDVRDAMRFGADGYLLKDSDPGELLSAVRAVAAGSGPNPGIHAGTMPSENSDSASMTTWTSVGTAAADSWPVSLSTNVSAMTCGWHISSSVSGERTSSTGAATKPPQRAMSVAVDRSPPAGSRA